jgi:hypothetical protein
MREAEIVAAADKEKAHSTERYGNNAGHVSPW